MKIVWLISLYPPYIVGGNEIASHGVVERLRSRGYDVHVLTGRGRKLDGHPYIHQVFNYSLDRKEEIFLGAKKLSLLDLFRHHIFDLVTYRKVRLVAQQIRPDWVIVDNLYMASAAPLLAVRDLPCPIIAHVTDKWLLYELIDWGLVVKPRTRFQKLLVEGVRVSFQRVIAKYARLDGIAVVSNFIGNFYAQAGFPPEIIRTVYLGYDESVFKPGPYHPLGNPVRLIFVGALWEGKGPQVAIEALYLLSQREDIPPVHLDIFGDGAEGFKQYLHRLILERGLSERVTFHGFVPWPQLVQAMHRSDILVFPSIWDEPFAAVPIQAMACGLPVVATWAGGTPEGFADGETALLVPPNDPQALADAIVRLVRDEDLRRKLRENGIRDAQERWGFEAYVNRLLDFCQQTAERWRNRKG